MKPQLWMHVGASLGHVVVGFLLASCGSTNPTAPTARPVHAGSEWSATQVSSGSLSETSISWSCLTATGTAAFASTGCHGAGRHNSARERSVAPAVASTPVSLSGSVNGNTVSLNWVTPASPDPATSFVVEAGSSPGLSNIASFDTGSTATTLTVSDVPANTYFVRVRAKNSSGVSAPSNEIVITIGGAACTPEPPTGLTASVNGPVVTFTWAAPTGACQPLGYQLVAGSSPGASNLASVTLGPSSTTFAASVPLGTYFVRVFSGTPASPGRASNEVTVTVALRGDVSDPTGDALPVMNVPNPPDLVSGTAEVRDGNIIFAVRLAPGTFNPQTTLLIIYLDTDQNQATGVQTAAGGLGVDYLVSMFGPNPALVQRITNPGGSTGSAPTSVVIDGSDVIVPLSLIGSDDGRLHYRVSSFVVSPGATNPTSGILDTMPGAGLPPGRVQ